MQKESFEFLKQILETPSPSGFEWDVQRKIKRRVSHYADTIEADVNGNLVAAVNPDAKVRIMLAGHCDQIGFMITQIDERGFLWFSAIGGIDPSVLPGARVTILADDGPIPGVIGYRPAHLVPAHDRGKPAEINKLWIDIGAQNGKEAKSKIRVGDAAVYQPGVLRMGKNLIYSPGCDDKAGTFVVMEALRHFAAAVKGKKSLPVGLFAVSTVQEEIGIRGARTAAFKIDPHVGIAVDVTHASDNPGAEAKVVGDRKLGDGPSICRGPNINPVIERLLIETAKRKKIKYGLEPAPGATGTDANALQLNRAGVATALIGIPNRYMHTQVEAVDLRDLDAAARLIAETALRITARTNFVSL